jgi:hypothetical protein
VPSKKGGRKKGGFTPSLVLVKAKPGINAVFVNNKRIVFKDGTAMVTKTIAEKLEKGGYIYQRKGSTEQNVSQPQK